MRVGASPETEARRAAITLATLAVELLKIRVELPEAGQYRQPRIVSPSDLPRERLHQRSLVMENSGAGVRQLTFVLPVVVGAKEQLPVPAFRDMNAEQNVGLGAAPITAINSIENHHCRVMPPWGAKAPEPHPSTMAEAPRRNLGPIHGRNPVSSGRSRESTGDTRLHARHEDGAAELLPAALDEGYGVT